MKKTCVPLVPAHSATMLEGQTIFGTNSRPSFTTHKSVPPQLALVLLPLTPESEEPASKYPKLPLRAIPYK